MSKEEKDSTLQVMRGIAIVLVLVWHSISQANRDPALNRLGQIIICFHMPIFFVIAGFLFEKGLAKYLENGRRAFLKKKAKHLLVPYVFQIIEQFKNQNLICGLDDCNQLAMAWRM